MHTCTPNPHAALQLLQSEVTHVAGVQCPGAVGCTGVGLEGRPTPPCNTAVGPGGDGASVGLPRTAGLGEGVVAGVAGASVGACTPTRQQHKLGLLEMTTEQK